MPGLSVFLNPTESGRQEIKCSGKPSLGERLARTVPLHINGSVIPRLCRVYLTIGKNKTVAILNCEKGDYHGDLW